MRLELRSVRSPAGWLGLLVGLVAFSLIAASPAVGVAGYGDVAEGRYFTEPVQWSADNDITGIDGSCFLPDAVVSRGEAAVYIWNMEGRPPAPAHSFVDITDESQDAAVSWMSHNQITTGTSDTTFEPDTTLTRAHLVTFLHRLAGMPQAPAHSFVDVFAAWQQAGVSWASDTQITTGTSPTTFEPDKTLTRAHLVTFLYRYQGEPTVTVDPDTPTCEAFKAIDAGMDHTCAVRTDATIICWGSNEYGQTDAPDGAFTAVSAGSLHTCALRTDATITCWGSNFYGEGDAPSGAFTAISAGSWHTCALRTDATITCSGINTNDQGVQVGQAVAPEGTFTAISAGHTHSCGLRTDATITCWGSNIDSWLEYVGQSDPPEGAFTAVSAGGWHTCGLSVDTTIACWGRNDSGQSDPIGGAFTAVSAGGWHTCALNTDAAVSCWGLTGYAEVDPSITNLIQAVYVVPAGTTPPDGQTAAIAHEIGVVQSWFDTQTDGLHPIFTRDGDSFSVVTVNLSSPLGEFTSITPILAEIHAAVPSVASHALVIYIEGEFNRGSCGWTRAREIVIPIHNCDIRPVQGSEWPHAATYLLAHELTHLLGAVPPCAPNYDGTWHVDDDRRDVLYNGPERRDWDNLMLDPGNDDYYMHGRDDCPDIVDSPLLGSD